jgi:hypothetical protein
VSAKHERITRSIPSHDVDLLADCTLQDVARIEEKIVAAIRIGAPAYNAGDHEACFRTYEATAHELDRVLKRCTLVRRALLEGVRIAAARDGFTAKAWAMRDAFDGVLDVIERKHGDRATKPTYLPVRRVTKLDLAVLNGCSAEAIAHIQSAINDAIEVGAPLYNEGHAEACFRIYEGTLLRLLQAGRLPAAVTAFIDAGLALGGDAQSWEAKAWAMRDTFDQLLDVTSRQRDTDLN